MPVQGIKTIAAQRNGVAAFLPQCRTLLLHYCDTWGSSRGMNAFLRSTTTPSVSPSNNSPSTTTLTQLARHFPSTEFKVSPRANHHPVLRAQYINGREKSVCVRNMSPAQIGAMAEYLLSNSGAKVKKVGSKKVVAGAGNESVRGIWSPMHGEIKDV